MNVSESSVLHHTSQYDACWSAHSAHRLKDLLAKENELKKEFMAAFEENLILEEISAYPNEWKTIRDAEKKDEDPLPSAFEINTALNKRLDKMVENIGVAAEVLSTWKYKAGLLSQKINELKAKTSELEGFDSNANSPSLYQLEIRNKLKKVKVMIEAAKEERDILSDRIARMENSLEHLIESESVLERKYALQNSQLQSLKQQLSDMQMLSGVEYSVLENNVLRITLQPKNLTHLGNLGDNGGEDLEECKFTADLKFAENRQGCLEITDVETFQNTEEVQQLKLHVKQDKDLPKFICGLKNVWLSFLPLNIEVSCLRKSHAIDFVQEEGVVYLIIDKRNIVCSLNVPKSYPHADVTLISVTGSDVTTVNISKPPSKTLTSWVKYLEDLLGQH